MMKVLSMVLVLLLRLFVTNACTEFRLTSEDNSVVVGRSMEFFDVRYDLVVEPEQYPHIAIPKKECFVNSQSLLQWKNKFSIAYVNALD